MTAFYKLLMRRHGNPESATPKPKLQSLNRDDTNETVFLQKPKPQTLNRDDTDDTVFLQQLQQVYKFDPDITSYETIQPIADQIIATQLAMLEVSVGWNMPENSKVRRALQKLGVCVAPPWDPDSDPEHVAIHDPLVPEHSINSPHETPHPMWKVPWHPKIQAMIDLFAMELEIIQRNAEDQQRKQLQYVPVPTLLTSETANRLRNQMSFVVRQRERLRVLQNPSSRIRRKFGQKVDDFLTKYQSVLIERAEIPNDLVFSHEVWKDSQEILEDYKSTAVDIATDYKSRTRGIECIIRLQPCENEPCVGKAKLITEVCNINPCILAIDHPDVVRVLQVAMRSKDIFHTSMNDSKEEAIKRLDTRSATGKKLLFGPVSSVFQDKRDDAQRAAQVFCRGSLCTVCEDVLAWSPEYKEQNVKTLVALGGSGFGKTVTIQQLASDIMENITLRDASTNQVFICFRASFSPILAYKYERIISMTELIGIEDFSTAANPTRRNIEARISVTFKKIEDVFYKEELIIETENNAKSSRCLHCLFMQVLQHTQESQQALAEVAKKDGFIMDPEDEQYVIEKAIVKGTIIFVDSPGAEVPSDVVELKMLKIIEEPMQIFHGKNDGTLGACIHHLARQKETFAGHASSSSSENARHLFKNDHVLKKHPQAQKALLNEALSLTKLMQESVWIGSTSDQIMRLATEKVGTPPPDRVDLRRQLQHFWKKLPMSSQISPRKVLREDILFVFVFPQYAPEVRGNTLFRPVRNHRMELYEQDVTEIYARMLLSLQMLSDSTDLFWKDDYIT